jgi:phosphonate transport system substrate-binding protein
MQRPVASRFGLSLMAAWPWWPLLRIKGSLGAPPLLVALLVLLIVGRALPAMAEPDDRGYRFGVFPYVPALTIDRLFGPMAANLGAAIDRPVLLKTKSTFEKFAEELRAQSYDLIFVHPFFYIDAVAESGYRPLARLDRRLTAVVMVGEDQPGQAWSDLSGKTIALPPALSAVSEMVKASLVEAELIAGVDVTLRHYRTKTSCLHAVVIGTADACAVPRFILDQIDASNALKLRIMVATPEINHFVFAVHPRVPADDVANLRARIVGWSNDTAGQTLLAAGAWPGFVVASDEDYDEVRAYRRQQQRLARR